VIREQKRMGRPGRSLRRAHYLAAAATIVPYHSVGGTVMAREGAQVPQRPPRWPQKSVERSIGRLRRADHLAEIVDGGGQGGLPTGGPQAREGTAGPEEAVKLSPGRAGGTHDPTGLIDAPGGTARATGECAKIGNDIVLCSGESSHRSSLSPCAGLLPA